MEVIRKKLSELTPDSKNVRKHNKKNLEAIKYSLQTFSQQKPIVIDDQGKIIAGNGTYQAAKELGWVELDCAVAHLSDKELTAFAIADNRASELASWDFDFLLRELKFQDEEFMAKLSFTIPESKDNSKEIEDILKELKHTCPKCGFDFD